LCVVLGLLHLYAGKGLMICRVFFGVACILGVRLFLLFGVSSWVFVVGWFDWWLFRSLPLLLFCVVCFFVFRRACGSGAVCLSDMLF